MDLAPDNNTVVLQNSLALVKSLTCVLDGKLLVTGVFLYYGADGITETGDLDGTLLDKGHKAGRTILDVVGSGVRQEGGVELSKNYNKGCQLQFWFK